MSGIDYSKFLRRVRHRTWNGEYKPMSINLTREEWQQLQQIYATTNEKPATFATRAVREALKNATLGVDQPLRPRDGAL